MVDAAKMCSRGDVRKEPFVRVADAEEIQVGAEDAPGGVGSAANADERCFNEDSSIDPSYGVAGIPKREVFENMPQTKWWR